MGHRGNPGHPDVQAAIAAAIKSIGAAGKAAGILASEQADVKRYLAAGCVFVVVGSDVALLARGASDLAARFQKTSGPRRGSSYRTETVMRIGIIGAGAIGGWIGVLLAKDCHDVSVLARGATLAALRAGPWRLSYEGKTIEATVSASADTSDLGVQDVIIVAVKGPALAAVAPAIRNMIGPSSIVVPAMNGVPWWFLLAGAGSVSPRPLKSIDPDGTIAASIPLETVIGCVVHASAASLPGLITHKGGKKLILGEPSGKMSDRLQSLAAMFEHAGFEAPRSARIQQDIWYKLWGNMTMNPISALTGATCNRILDDELINDFVLRVMAEASEVGNHIGCAISERGEDRIAVTRKLGAFKTSMLQDAEAGRPLEIDQLLTAPREIARMVSVPTPNMDTLLGLTRTFGRVHGLYP